MISDHLLSQVIVGIGNKITKEVRLRVKTPVAILDSSTTKLTVVEGEEAKLECKVSPDPINISIELLQYR